MQTVTVPVKTKVELIFITDSDENSLDHNGIMDGVPEGEPVVIVKPETPFYRSPKFLVIG